MFDLDLWREIFQSINKNRTRSLLSGFTVAFAIMLFTILFGIANGLENTFDELFVRAADNQIWINAGRTSKPYNGLQEDRVVYFTNEDYKYLIKEYKDKIQYITPKVSREFNASYKNEDGKYFVLGTRPDAQFIEKTFLEKGRFFNINDINETNKVIVVGRLVEEDLFKNESALGKSINIEGVIYTIIGVFSDNGGDSEERLIYAPISTVHKLYFQKPEFTELNLTYNADMSSDEALAFGTELMKTLKARHNVAPSDQRGIRINNMAMNTKGIETLTWGLGILIFIIGLGTLIAGIVGISNIMIFIVKERTKEIGIRKALGASPNSIVSIILIESILITTFAGYLGLLIGVGILDVVGPSLEDYFITNPGVKPSIVFTSTIVLIGAGALAGFLPAKKASQIKPIIALRNG